MNAKNDLNYVKAVLQQAEKGNRYPLICVMWGAIIFLGFAIAEFVPHQVKLYWLIATPVGVFGSAFIALQKDRDMGQRDTETGKMYSKHFGVMVVFIFTAMFTTDGLSIILLLGLTYSLAGLYLDKRMMIIGILSWLLYLGIYFGVLQSNLLIGLVFASGFFVTAYTMSKDEKPPSDFA